MTIILRNQHSISRKNIGTNALKVLYHLTNTGFEAYLVGGGVRDLLLGQTPKDFDITTNATPEQMRQLFRNCRLVGRRFRLAHVIFRSEIIEVATFRGHGHQPTSIINSRQSDHNRGKITNHNGLLLRDNIFGSMEEDAYRRDFSVNSLYYNVSDFTLRDYTGGLKDLRAKTIRLIGDPETRYREDPIRMLRAVRFAAKLNMTISDETAEPIARLATLLYNISPVRLFEEALKLFQAGYSKTTYHLLCQYQLFQRLFPLISQQFTEHGNSYIEQMIIDVLTKIDAGLPNDRWVNLAFLFATMLWYPLLAHTTQLTRKTGLSYLVSFSLASNQIIHEQCRTLVIPKRLISLMRNIWQLQLWLSRHHGQRDLAYKLINYPKFRAAYDLLTLRAKVENNAELQRISSWWHKIITH